MVEVTGPIPHHSLAGIRRAILSSRGHRNGPGELQQIEYVSSGGHTIPADVILLSRRLGRGLKPTHLLLS